MSEIYSALPVAAIPKGIVYGPIQSRRLGRSLGINLSGDSAKVCSFDCVYCDLGPTELRLNRVKTDVVFPTPEKIEAETAQALRAIRNRSETIDWLCVSGNGEPTLHPEFEKAVDALLAARKLEWPELKICILTNAANADSRRIRGALDLFDERMVKIDAGNDRLFKAVNVPLARASLAKIIANSRSLKNTIVQSFFMRGDVDNTTAADVDEWIEAVALIQPKRVHLVGMSRAPARPGLIRVEEDALYFIGSKLERRTQIKSLVFP